MPSSSSAEAGTGCDGPPPPPPPGAWVELERIDPHDERFRISPAGAVDALCDSIAAVGLLLPPLLRAEGERLSIVSGFRRVEACRRLGWRRLPARIHPTELGRYDAARRAVGENATARPLDPIETGRALRLLESCAPPGGAPPRDLAALGLPTSPVLIRRLTSLAALPESVQEGVREGSIALAVAFALLEAERGFAAAMADLLRPLRASLNRQREIIEMVDEIARREGIAPTALLEEPAFCAVLERPEADRNARTRALRQWLRRRRFPVLTAVERRFEEVRRRLDLDESLKLSAPAGFEGPGVVLQVTVADPADLERQRGRLNALFDHPEFRGLLVGKGRGFAPADDGGSEPAAGCPRRERG